MLLVPAAARSLPLIKRVNNYSRRALVSCLVRLPGEHVHMSIKQVAVIPLYDCSR
jgi:hypothetical protein